MCYICVKRGNTRVDLRSCPNTKRHNDWVRFSTHQFKRVGRSVDILRLSVLLSIKDFHLKTHIFHFSFSKADRHFIFLKLCVALCETLLCFVLRYEPQRYVMHLLSVEKGSTTSFLSLLSTYLVTSVTVAHYSLPFLADYNVK